MFKTFVNASAGVAGPGGMQPVSSPSGGGAQGGWRPGVLYMLGLVAAEIAAVWYIGKKL